MTQEKIPLNIDLGKIPPQAVDLEEAVLGTLISFPLSIYEIADILNEEAFYRDEHQKICGAITNLFDQNKSIDLLTVTEELRKQKWLDEIGGPVYISQLSTKISSSSHLKEHYSIVFQKYIQRELIRYSSQLSNIGFDEGVDMEDLVNFANKEMDLINDKVAGKKQASHISEVLKRSMIELENREKAAKENRLVGIKTPVVELDKKTQGWKPNVIVLAASSGEGKTAAALAVAKSAAMVGTPVCIYSLEMQDISLVDRFILSEADVRPYNFASGYITKEEKVSIERARERLQKLPIYIDDNPIVNFTYIKTHARLMHQKGKCELLILDYLQLADTDKSETRERELAKFMRNLVILKKQLNIPIIALSQLNRKYENLKTKRPTLGQLRESGAIEQDADIVIFIYRPEYHGIYEDFNGNSTKGVGEFIIAKHRNGPIGTVKFAYNESITKIYDYIPEDRFKPIDSGKDRQLPPEKDDEDYQGDIPF